MQCGMRTVNGGVKFVTISSVKFVNGLVVNEANVLH